jgi:Na+/melibiose symporter-like transporter
VVGALTVTGGLVVIVFATVRSQAWGLGSARTIAAFLTGVPLLVWFVLQESGLARHPLVPLRVFANRSLVAANIVMFLVGCAMFAAFFFITLYMQQVRGDSPLEAGVAFLPLAVGIIAGSTAATQMVGKLGVKTPLVICLVLTSTGMLLFARLSVAGSIVTALLIPEVAFGVGAGLAFSVGAVLVVLAPLTALLTLPSRPRNPLSPEPQPIEIAA